MGTPKALESVRSRSTFGATLGRFTFCIALSCAMAPSLLGEDSANSNESAVCNPALREELVSMAREDQAVRIGGLRALRKRGISIGDATQLKDPKVQEILKAQTVKMANTDTKHRRRLKQIIDEHGWPGKSLVGRDGAQAAWLIVQHSDADVMFQCR